MEPECPRCHSFNTLHVPSVYSSQSFGGSYDILGNLLGGQVQVRSHLAGILAPPDRPPQPTGAYGWIAAFPVVGAFILWCITLSILANPTTDPLPWFGASLLATGAAAGMWCAAYYKMSADKREYESASAVHISRMMHWERSRLCAQCGAVFVPTLPPAAGTTPLPAAPGQQIAPRRP